MNALVLVAEDEPEVARIIMGYLDREGLRTVRAENGQIALDLHQQLKPDLVILDVKMPKLDGFEVLAGLRRRGDTPVIMVTALDEDLDKLQALRIGADDYIVKPFNPLEVVARVKAVLRRAMGRSDSAVIRVGPVEIDLTAYAVNVQTGDARVRVDLTATEFRILSHMARQPTRVFSRAELIDACLPESDTLERTIDTHASNIRRKLQAAGLAAFFEGVRGVGYRLTAAP
ncbi:two-component system response regulator AdeR [Azospirillum lipoferum]|uniref:Response regulator transcription factor n=1 Tax=Azospirillum lipoferum TaxID=193 RepID=A0A5A9GNT9_AZOLI|nr:MULTISPECIES: response regulator [Azospirillum]KAA0595392.1 response regulator transcription factor [Azospirillum lipoferum]MCP1611708.1 two-component system response regulator AdeR [Azospirillum lipoferum]MDW5533533.1 response regulator [Azospirillum sp. NL1]